jgi:hypothetical protein
MKIISRSLVTTLVLLCFRLLQTVEAVVPLRTAATPTLPPRKGRIAFFSLTSGAANIALGRFSLHSVTTGSFNTGIDAGTLVLNTGDENTAIGTAALLLNTASNTAVASRALLNNTTGGTLTNIQRIDVGPNVAVGQQGLESNTVVGANTAVGYQALHSLFRANWFRATRSPYLVARDKNGKSYSVRYNQVNAMLLNEFLKEHATVQNLKKEFAALR